MLSLRQALREIDIGPEQQLGEVELTGHATGAAVAGSLIAIDGSVTEQHVRDVLQSVLLAQLAASAKADRHKDPANWYKVHQSTLEQIAWVVSASTSFVRYLPQTSRYTMSTVVTDLYRPKTTQEELSLISRTLSAFVRDQGAPAQFVWECPSHSGGIGNFQFGLVTEGDDNTVTLKLGRFSFKTPTHVTRLAFEEFDKDAKFLSSYAAMTMNEEVFAQLRSAIAKKLENRFSGSVAQITLSSD